MTKKATLLSVLAGSNNSGEADVITVNSGTITDIDFASPFIATATIIYELDGTITTLRQQGADNVDTLGDWISPLSSAPGNYEIRATLNSGSLTSGTTGTWQALSTDRAWSVSREVSGTSSANLTIEIRSGSGPTLDSGTIILQVECGF